MDKPSDNLDDVEIITPEEFMARMHIKRTTYHKWKRTGMLVRGRHYIQVGGVTRILWSVQLLKDLDNPGPKTVRPAKEGCQARKPRTRGCAINLSY